MRSGGREGALRVGPWPHAAGRATAARKGALPVALEPPLLTANPTTGGF